VIKLLLLVATLGLATFVVLRRKRPDLADQVEDVANGMVDELVAAAAA
jgi:hypothetical protein